VTGSLQIKHHCRYGHALFQLQTSQLLIEDYHVCLARFAPCRSNAWAANCSAACWVILVGFPPTISRT